MTINKISLDELTDTLFTRPGLVIGERATCLAGELRDITNAVNDKAVDILGLSDPNDLQTIFEIARGDEPSKYETLLDIVKEHFKTKVGPNTINHLVKVNWSACISLTIDYRFESALRTRYSAMPTQRDATVVARGGLILPPSSTPVYKLNGDLNDIDNLSEVAIANSDILKRKLMWGNILQTCPDYLKGAPLIFMGTEHNLEDVKWLLTSISAMPNPIPRNLIFLSSDPTFVDTTVSSLLNGFDVKHCDASIVEAAGALAELKPRQGTLILPPASSGTKKIGIDEDKYKQIVSLVPNKLPADFDYASNHSAVIDALFRPHQINWLPYLLKLAASRTITKNVIAHINETIPNSASQGVHEFVLLHGDASVGKTTMLKQIAVELSMEGYVVVWVRRRWSGSPTSLFSQLVNDINNHVSKNTDTENKLIVICDNPMGLNIAPKDILEYFSGIKCNTKFIFSARNSDYLSIGEHDNSLSTTAENDFDVDNKLDEEELKSLADMLVAIKAEETIESALAIVNQLTTKYSMDVLCSLWYLVPETKAVISDSLEDEYLRLGRIQPAIKSAAANLESTSTIAKEAYAAVTVVSNMGEGLPLEILVRYLKVDYNYLLELYEVGTPIWGLIYDEVSEESETVLFRTRNEIVTKVLLDLVNGGAAGHSGEASVIRKLIEACDGGSTVYREFIITLLVKCRKRIQTIFSYEEGIEIFDLAREALSHSDRTLEHHKGLWMRRESSQLAEAYKQLEYAESCDDFPGTNRKTPIEHIYTSRAAAVLSMIQTGQQAKESGSEEIARLLSLATSESSFDGHTVHVAARTYFKLSQTPGKSQFGIIETESISKALFAIENGLQKIGSLVTRRNKLKNIRSVELLRELRTQILSSTDSIETLKSSAQSEFDRSGNGAGFTLAARVELNKATFSDKGSSYNKLKQYLDECLEYDLSADHRAHLLAVRIDVIIRWRLQKTTGLVEWNEFRDDLENVLAFSAFKDDMIKTFYLAVAMFHLGNIASANAYFSTLKRTSFMGIDKGLLRCWYIGKEGSRKRLQCNVKKQGIRYYAEFPELRTDCSFNKLPSGAGVGGINHAYLGFSFLGPVPIFDKTFIGGELLLA